MITEWEKNLVKPLFKALDKGNPINRKKRILNREGMTALFEKLAKDDQKIGKVPDCGL